MTRVEALAIVSLFFVAAGVGPMRPTIGCCDELNSADIDRLVQSLGAPSFIERQLATEDLSTIRLEEAGPIEAACASSDPEVRFRAKEILRVIRHDDRQRLISAFIAGVSVESEEDLPGWSHFCEIAGRTEPARQLYVSMLEDEWMFLDAAYEADAAVSQQLLQTRARALEKAARERARISVGSVAALMLVAVRDEIGTASHGSNLMSLCYRAKDFDGAIRSGESSEALRKLMGRLIAQPANSPYLNQSFHFALNYELKEGLAPARQVISERSGIPYVRQYALLVLGKLGEDDDMELVESMLDDAGIISSHNRINRVRVTTQVRDIALAILIKRSGNSFSDFGLSNVKPNSVMMFQPTSIGFANDEDREEAIRRWMTHDQESQPPADPVDNPKTPVTDRVGAKSADPSEGTDAKAGGVQSTESNRAQLDKPSS